jgi:hypothetical protein
LQPKDVSVEGQRSLGVKPWQQSGQRAPEKNRR